jgi:uncharacterized membrane protein
MSALIAVLVATFLACLVEAVEAVTVVLAVGLTRGWTSAVQGVTAGVLVLAAIVAALGPALTVVPIDTLRLVVGALLLIFGLGWLRKAILRASGLKALHDEAAIYDREADKARSAARGGRWVIADGYGFTLTFKAVVLEGLEVAFIVLTFGTNAHHILPAAAAAIAAILVVTAAAVRLRAPLARVPENTLKFAVGVLLTSFGIFWGAEGAGVSWPGADVSLLWLVPMVLIVALGMVRWLRRAGAAPTAATREAAATGGRP